MRLFFILALSTSALSAFAADTGVFYTKKACEVGSAGCFKRESVERLPLNYTVDANGKPVEKDGQIVPRWNHLLPAEKWDISYRNTKANDGSNAADHMERKTRVSRKDEQALLQSRGFTFKPYQPNRAIPNTRVVRSENGDRK